MPTYNILSPSILLETWTLQEWSNLCCWEQPPYTYEAFLTGATEVYNNACLKDRVFSDYITQLYNESFSANTDTFVSGGTLNPGTGVVTFRNTTGGTIDVSGFDGFASYWSANTNGSITNSGNTDINTTGNGNFANLQVPAGGYLRFDDVIGSDDQYILGNENNITVDGDQKVKLIANDVIEVGVATNDIKLTIDTSEGSISASGDISGSTDVHVGNDLRVNNDAIINDDLTVNDTSLYVSSTSGRTGAGTIKPTHTLTVSADTRYWNVWNPEDLASIGFNNGVNFISYSETGVDVPAALAVEGTSVRVLVGGVYYYGTTASNGGGAYGFANGRGYFGLTWAGANTAITDGVGLVVSYGGGDLNNFAVYNLTGTTPALQVVGNSVMSGSTDLLNMFTTTATTINGGTF
tara:strand:+ start:271 stop:1494 length:1224 start_codon:yes stop_codon:yes gene_type:complete